VREIQMEKIFFVLGAILGGLAVASGAFGAHGLKNIVTSDRLETFETAVRYQTYHAFALIAVAWALARWPNQVSLLNTSGWLFLAGIILFSGSLYLLVLSGVKWLGAITPFGGVAFVAGWICLAIAAWRS
jgi:uncharacterized membrane protein YgdD (TMEM256/DUF423 family)